MNTEEMFFELESRTNDLQSATDLLRVFISFLEEEQPKGERADEDWRCKNFADRMSMYESVLHAAFEKLMSANAAIEEIISKQLKGEAA